MTRDAYEHMSLFSGVGYFISNHCNKKIRETLYCTLFYLRILTHLARGKFKRFPPAINNGGGGTHPVLSSIVQRSYRYCEDFGRDPPAICRLREGFFHNYDFETVLPVLKTTAVGNFPVLIRFVLSPTRYSVFCSICNLIQSGSILSC
jgi:hypothetical protein